MNHKNKLKFNLRKNDLRYKYYRDHFSDHPIIFFLKKKKLIVSLNVEIYTQSIKKIKNKDINQNKIVDIKNNKILKSLQKLLNDYPYAESVDLHLQECYPSLYYLISTKLKFLKKLSKPTKLICQNIFEGWDILGDNPKIIYGGRPYNNTSFCSFRFSNENNNLPTLPKFFNTEDREKEYYEKLLVYYSIDNDKFLKASPVFLEINRNPYSNEFLGNDYLFVTCRGIYISEMGGINIHLERDTITYIIDEIKNGKLFRCWLNGNSQKYFEEAEKSFKKYIVNTFDNYDNE